MMTDPIADMLTRIRNGQKAHKTCVEVLFSYFKRDIVRLLVERGYLRGYKVLDLGSGKKLLKIYLRYNEKDEPVIRHIERVSKPGRRAYRKVNELDSVRNNLGMAVVSTSKGVLTDHQARVLGIGGELVCEIW
ncbi:MAG: 30S ribosomal protein S8 [candidate division Zixibacteria bacterium 4484_93]|nr:MAG: 30S ribosomal protein S8 [candidate division Zixibacteria bacterium 4484_93]RKZ34006.1 MAG: 30S ribosomal protein S8 [bacterium]